MWISRRVVQESGKSGNWLADRPWDGSSSCCCRMHEPDHPQGSSEHGSENSSRRHECVASEE